MKEANAKSMEKDFKKKMKKIIERNITMDTSNRMQDTETKDTTDKKEKSFLEGVSPSSKKFAVATGRALVTIIVLVYCHVSNFPINAEPLSASGSQTSGSSGASLPGPAWSGRSGSLTDQIMMRHVYEQVRSLKFAYEENINQLLRKVDNIDMKLVRQNSDYNGIEALVRKIDSLDIKVNRLETSNVHRLEELSKTIHTKGIRQELAMDGLVQKVDENHERIKQKLIFAEKRLETINSKMQVYETSFTRVESRLTDIDNEISDISTTLDDIKSLSTYIDDKHNNTQRTMKEHLEAIKSETASRHQLQELSSRMNDIGSRLNDTTTTPMVRDDESVHRLSADTDRSLMMDLRTQINYESRQIEDKITSMYNNLWSRFMSLETTAKHLLKINNITRRQLREDFQSLLQSEARYIEPESQENYMNLLLDVLKRMLQEHKDQMDSNLQMSLTSQNLFIDSLNKSVHYSNDELKDMEITLSSILEKIIYTITNKTSRMDGRLVEVMQMIKEYKTQTMRGVTHLTKMVISLTEKNKEDKEQYERGILDLTKMNEIIASVLQELYENVDMIGNMTHSCVEITRKTQFNQTKENDTREVDVTDSEEQENEPVPENKINIDDVIKIYSENGTNMEHKNTSYRVLNTANTTQTNETTRKKHISIVIPYEDIEEDILKSKLQDFLSQLPVYKTEAIILTNSKQQKSDNGKVSQENNGRLLEEIINKEQNFEQTIHITLNDGISGNSTNYNNITTSSRDKIDDNGQKFNESANYNISDSGSSHDTVTMNSRSDGIPEYDKNINNNERIVINNNEEGESFEETKTLRKENEEASERNKENKKFYDLDGNDELIVDEKPKEHGGESIQNGDEKKIYDWDQWIRSMEESTLEKQMNENFEKLENRMEVTSADREGGKTETSTVKNENLFPILSFNNVTDVAENSSQFAGSATKVNEKIDIDSATSISQTIQHKHGDLSEPEGGNVTENIVTEIVTVSSTSEVSQLLTASTSSTSTTKPMLLKLPTTIETATYRNEKSKRRTKQDIKQLFEELKTKRQQRIHELQSLAKENEMMQKDFEEEIKNDETPLFVREGETPLARRDTSEHFRPITSSEESANSEPAFDLLYDEQEMPYSA